MLNRFAIRSSRNILAQNNSRFFAAAAADYQSINNERWYTPQNPVNGNVIFNGEDVQERRFVPWEVKEATFKNGMGIVGTYMLSLYLPLGYFYMASNTFFCVNYSYQVIRMMSNAVTKMELMQGGTQVRLTFGRGRNQ